MYLLSKIIQICCLTTIMRLQEATTYVLLTADLEDFRTIAKKFVPSEVADQIVEMALQPTTAQAQPTYNDYSDVSYETKTVNVQQKEKRNRNDNPQMKIQKDISKINIDDVVEQVKERLANEYANKYKETTQNKQLYIYVPKEQKKYEDYEEDAIPYKAVRTTREYKNNVRNSAFYSERTKQYNKVTTPTYNKWNVKETEFEKTNVKVEEEIGSNKGNDDIIRGVDLTKTKDSYEDYVTPKKENIFESSETTKNNVKPKETRFIKVKNKPENISLNKWKKVINKRIRSRQRTTPEYDDVDEDEHEVTQEPEIKAETVNLLNDEGDQTAGLKGQSKLRGTIIPKRDFYKISSPKYSTVPNVAEKYDFNEPIPEKDREPEKFKPIGDQTALINKKVRIL